MAESTNALSDYQFLHIWVLGLQMLIGLLQLFLLRGWQKVDNRELSGYIENLKNAFHKENAKLQAELEILKDKEGKIYTQKQQAVLTFFTDLNVWTNQLMAVELSVYEDGVNGVNELLKELDKLYYKATLSNSLMDLLVNDTNNGTIGYELMVEGLKLHNYVDFHVRNYKDVLVSYNELMEDYKVATKQNLPDTLINSLKQEKEKLDRVRQESSTIFTDGRMPIFEEVNKRIFDFRDIAFGYLHN